MAGTHLQNHLLNCSAPPGSNSPPSACDWLVWPAARLPFNQHFNAPCSGGRDRTSPDLWTSRWQFSGLQLRREGSRVSGAAWRWQWEGMSREYAGRHAHTSALTLHLQGNKIWLTECKICQYSSALIHAIFTMWMEHGTNCYCIHEIQHYCMFREH